MNRGYIKIWRKLEDSGLLQMHGTLALFIHILMKAVYKPTKVGSPCGVINLERGQYVSGRHKLAEAVGLSEQAVRTCISNLERLEIITSRSTNRYSVYTIVNYNNYQDVVSDTNQQGNQPATSQQPTTNQPATTKEELKHLSIKEKKLIVRASRLPPDWEMPAEYGNWALSEKPNWTNETVLKVAENFRDYWVAKAGAGACKADWMATWRIWVRKTYEN